MYDCELMKNLNAALEEKERIFKFSSAELRKKKYLRIVLITSYRDYDNHYSYELQDKVESELKKILPGGTELTVDIIKSYTDVKRISEEIYNFVYQKYPSLFNYLRDNPPEIKIKSDKVTVTCDLESYLYTFFTEIQLGEKISERLEEKFMESFEVVLCEKETDGGEMSDLPPRYIQTAEQAKVPDFKLIEISVEDHLVGIISRQPRYISEIKKYEDSNALVCGVIGSFRAVKMKKNPENEFYIFTLSDTTETINIKFFPGKNEKAKETGKLLKNGDTVAIEGDVRYDEYDGINAMFLRKIAKCKINYDSINTQPQYKDAPAEYKIIFPNEYKDENQPGLNKLFAEEKQANLFESVNTGAAEIEAEATGNEYIALYMPLDGDSDITEINAVKFIGRKPVSEFSVNFKRKEDKYSEPLKFEDVIGDFYKFIGKAAFIYYGSATPASLLIEKAKKELYNIDNKKIDLMDFAKKTLNEEKIKLDALCARLELPFSVNNNTVITTEIIVQTFRKLLSMV